LLPELGAQEFSKAGVSGALLRLIAQQLDLCRAERPPHLALSLAGT